MPVSNMASGEAQQLQLELMPLIGALFFASVSPIPVKAALSMMDVVHDELRLPLTPMEEFLPKSAETSVD